MLPSSMTASCSLKRNLYFCDVCIFNSSKLCIISKELTILLKKCSCPSFECGISLKKFSLCTLKQLITAPPFTFCSLNVCMSFSIAESLVAIFSNVPLFPSHNAHYSLLKICFFIINSKIKPSNFKIARLSLIYIRKNNHNCSKHIMPRHQPHAPIKNHK